MAVAASPRLAETAESRSATKCRELARNRRRCSPPNVRYRNRAGPGRATDLGRKRPSPAERRSYQQADHPTRHNPCAEVPVQTPERFRPRVGQFDASFCLPSEQGGLLILGVIGMIFGVLFGTAFVVPLGRKVPQPEMPMRAQMAIDLLLMCCAGPEGCAF